MAKVRFESSLTPESHCFLLSGQDLWLAEAMRVLWILTSALYWDLCWKNEEAHWRLIKPLLRNAQRRRLRLFVSNLFPLSCVNKMSFFILYSWVFLATYMPYLALAIAKLLRFTELSYPMPQIQDLFQCDQPYFPHKFLASFYVHGDAVAFF